MKNRTMVEMVKSMMHRKDLPYQFWVEEVNTVVYLLKKCPTKALDKMTPFEAYNGRKLENYSSQYFWFSVLCAHSFEHET